MTEKPKTLLQEIESVASRAESAADSASEAAARLENCAGSLRELMKREPRSDVTESLGRLVDFINQKLREVGIFRNALVDDQDLVSFAREMLEAHVKRAKEGATP